MKGRSKQSNQSYGFTVIELIVAVAVTALLSGLLIIISNQVLLTQTTSSDELETNEVAQFVLDRIQEDLQCAYYRNDGNVWMAMSILKDNQNSGESWKEAKRPGKGKKEEESYRITATDWSDSGITLQDSQIDALGQGPFEQSRFGVAGTWLRFFSQAPEPDRNEKNTGGVRAIAYQIIRHGITSASASKQRYQLFRTDITAKNTFEAGYNLHPDSEVDPTPYNGGSPLSGSTSIRTPERMIDPILPEGSDYPATSFSLAANIIDFGVRAYVLEKNSTGTGNLVQIFPSIHIEAPGAIMSPNYLATSLADPDKDYQTIIQDFPSRKNIHQFHAFPDVVDIMIRVLSEKGSALLETFENTDALSESDTFNWWSIAEEYSKVYFRRVKIYGQGL